MVRTALITTGLLLAVSVGLSFVHPLGNPRQTEAPAGTVLQSGAFPPNVAGIIGNKCIDCHSEQTRWPIYSRLAPVSWLLEYDVAEGRSKWNFSHWEHYSPEKRQELLSQIGLRARLGTMPPDRYLLLHPESKLTAEERATLYQWTKTERKRLNLRNTRHENSN